MSTIISPSLLSSDFLNLEQELQSFQGIKDLWFHLDIMDGHFVPNLTFGHPVIKKINEIAQHPLDAHFMVTNPEFYLETVQDFGLHNFTFHIETVQHLDRFIHKAKSLYKSVGIAFNPGTPLTACPDYLFREIDLVLIMTVNPGFGGQSFIKPTLEKIKTLKKIKDQNSLNFQIQVDGGIKDTNAQEVLRAGANNLVAGSYIFSSPSNEYAKKIESLR